MNMLAISLPFEFEYPAALWICAIIPVLVLVSLRSLAGVGPVRRVLAVIMRSLLVLLVAIALAGVHRVQRNSDLTVMFLMDRSYSVQQKLDEQETFIRAASKDIPVTDQVGMIDFARNAFLEQRPEHAFLIPPGRLPVMLNTDRTDIATAIRLAMAMFPHDTAKRIVLMSDGNENMGDVATEARRARAAGVPIDVVPLWYEHRNEVFFERMIAPTHAERGEQVPLRMVIQSHQRATGTIDIYHNGQRIELPPEYSHVELKPGSNTFFIKLPLAAAGTHTYEAVFRPDDESMDGVALNNSARAFTFVTGTSRVLLLTANASHDAALADALRSENVQVDMVATSDLGEFGLLQMMNYHSIILANVPAATFTEQQIQELAVYVKDMGSGLIMTGGDESFGAGGWIGTPVEKIMPVTFEVKHKRVIPRGALAVIMHSCEIPRGNFWGKEMAKKAADTISSQDYFGVVAYAFSPSGVNWEVPLGLNTNKAAVKAKIDKMQIGDMPDFHTAMQMVYRDFTSGIAVDAAQKHVIILSDGDAQPPTAALIKDYIDKKVTVSTIAIGWGAHVMERTMINIARRTGGKYYNARNPRALPQIFVKESKVVRRPLIIDEPFQPRIMNRDSDLLGGIDASRALPQLGGMILTTVRNSPNVLLPMIRVTDDGDDPVLAHWQYELGKTVAFTSGYWPLWGGDWTQWDQFAKLWAQIVRWTMRQETPANFETATKIEGNKGKIVIDALDRDANYLNFLNLQSRVVGPDGDAIPITFTQTGPGHYEAEFEAEKAGQYLASINVFERGQSRGTIRTGISLPFSPEYRDLAPNEPALRQIVDVTGGRWLDVPPDEANVFSHDLPPTESRRPAWQWVIAWLLLPAFLLDVAVRRLASWLALSIAVELVILTVLLFGLELRYASWWGIAGTIIFAELVGWTIRFRYIGPLFDFLTHGATASSRAGERSESALGKLKDTRKRAKEGLKSSEEAATRGETSQEKAPFDPSVARRRFDVGNKDAAQPTGDLRDIVGGAQREESTKDKPTKQKGKADAKGDDESDEDLSPTERLLRAKRRKREDDGS